MRFEENHTSQGRAHGSSNLLGNLKDLFSRIQFGVATCFTDGLRHPRGSDHCAVPIAVHSFLCKSQRIKIGGVLSPSQTSELTSIHLLDEYFSASGSPFGVTSTEKSVLWHFE